ncbi:Hypothetical protein FKW44_020659 [Caligus rogercresseyi]|uniref:Uncharacterized protein n=1 Tax=Caligus rogercresseyi TaxID=217165 RepID=A0A7T8GQK0_CALRO|nr:Hypothetical protein FKW44_020659 [Caligus rogercresseyi]
MSALPSDKPPDLQVGKRVINNEEKLHGEGKSEKEWACVKIKEKKKIHQRKKSLHE